VFLLFYFTAISKKKERKKKVCNGKHIRATYFPCVVLQHLQSTKINGV